MEDSTIIDLFFARSERAIGELDTKYGTLCHRVAHNITGNQPDAEECVNDAYLGVWNAIPPTRPNPLVTFVCKIVRNLSIGRFRANRAGKRDNSYDVSLSELEECFASPDTAETALNARELARLLERFLDGISPENRVIFLRRYWFSDSYAAIARQVGVSEKVISVRLSRIRAQLRAFLSEQEVAV